VNAYRTDGGEPGPKLLRVDERLARRRADDLRAYRARRDAAAASRARADLVFGARGSANLVPLILAAVRAGATLGEISEDLRGVFGVHVPPRG
jgi:methylmalonyl-CoA mutase N-terminal domain/subunit